MLSEVLRRDLNFVVQRQDLRLSGREFQMRGAAEEKDLSPHECRDLGLTWVIRAPKSNKHLPTILSNLLKGELLRLDPWKYFETGTLNIASLPVPPCLLIKIEIVYFDKLITYMKYFSDLMSF